MDNILPAIIAAIVALSIAVLSERRLRNAAKALKAKEDETDAVALRIREIDAVEEFRDTLRETVKDQNDRLQKFGEELEKARLARLEHERERLSWFDEREKLTGRIEKLEAMLKEEREAFEEERKGWALYREALESRLLTLENKNKAAIHGGAK